MSAGSIARRGRRAAQGLMTDACRVYVRAEGGGTFDPATGTITDADTDIYVGKCRVKQVPGYKTGGELVGESVVPRTAPVIVVPFDGTEDIRPSMRVVVTASADAALVDRPLLIEAVLSGTHATARRLVCEGLS